MSKITCIIVEDEPLAVRTLAGYIEQVPFLQLEGCFRDALLAFDYLHSNAIDLIFLDLHLPKLKGMDFLKTLRNPPAVIVTTAYHQYAVEGFALNVTDYLLKPFGFDRFLQAINKVKMSQEAVASLKDQVLEKDFIFLSIQKKKVKVYFADILYIESQKEYIKIVTVKNKEWVTKMSTQEIIGLIPDQVFKRVHRSFIVSVPKIESYTAEVVEINGVPIPIGREFKNVLAFL